MTHGNRLVDFKTRNVQAGNRPSPKCIPSQNLPKLQPQNDGIQTGHAF